MFEKIYLSRAQTRAMSIDMPIGDPTGGAAYGERNDPMTATAVIGSQIIGGAMGANAANDAADTQLEGTYAGIGEQRRQYEQNRADLEPYRTAGYGALKTLQDLIAGYQPFDGRELQNDPGYRLGLDEGRAAIEQSAAARGNLFSTKTLRDLARFGTDYGNTMFDRRMASRLGERAQRYNELAGLSGTGQTAAMGGAQLGANTAGSIADLLGSGAAASAAGRIGSANAIGEAISNAGNAYMQQSLLQRLMPTAPGGGSSGGVYGA